MPPKDMTNKNTPEPSPFKVGLDPVFQTKTNTNTAPQSASGIADILSNQEYKPDQKIDATIPKINIPQNNNLKKSIVRTYKDDLAQAINRDHLSSINIAIAENQKKQRVEEAVVEKQPSEYSKSKIIILISFVFILLGIGALAFIFLNQEKTTPVITAPELPSLITTEYKNEFNIGNNDQTRIISLLSNGLNTLKIPAGNFYNVYLTTGTSTTRRLLNSKEMISLLKLKIPDMIQRNLFPDFMLGMYKTETNNPFIIFKVSYFENAYAGMLEWEKVLEKDLQILFRLPGYDTAGSLLAELNAGETKKFQDAVILNKDVRLIKDESGKILLLYSIIDKETIVITVSDQAFKEIINRLNKEKTLRR